jgi:hypothetical protein
MAEPSFFADHEAFRRAGEEHVALSGQVRALYSEWETLCKGYS